MLKQLTTFVLLISVAAISFANTQIGRYMQVDNNVLLSQKEPLQQVFQITFPASITTVGAAMNFILVNTGFAMVPSFNRVQMINALMKQPLPLSDRTIGPTTVEQGLSAIAGNAYQLIIDPANRLVDFRLRPQYQPIYN
jgi:conjugative transfer region protein (TIGR03748 family)